VKKFLAILLLALALCSCGEDYCEDVEYDLTIRNSMDLLLRYEPILYLHSEEIYLPMDLNDYVEKCHLWKRTFVGSIGDILGGLFKHKRLTDREGEIKLSQLGTKFKYKNEEEDIIDISSNEELEKFAEKARLKYEPIYNRHYWK